MPIKVQKPQKGLLSPGSTSSGASCDFEGARGQKSCLILIVSINFKDVITLESLRTGKSRCNMIRSRP